MELLNSIKKSYYKLSLFIVIFIVVIIIHFFLLNFYKKNILKNIEEINNLKNRIFEEQNNLDKANKLNRINLLVKQRTNQNLDSIISNIQSKINRNFEEIKNLMTEKIMKEGWQVKATSIQENNKKINFVLIINNSDFDKFYDFLTESGIIWQIDGLKIKKTSTTFEVDLNLKGK